MTTILEVFDPTVEPIPAHGVIAKRPDTLNGAVVGLLANGKRNANLLLEMVHDVLADQFEFKTVVARNKGNASRPLSNRHNSGVGKPVRRGYHRER